MKPHFLIGLFFLLVVSACSPQQARPEEAPADNPLVVEGEKIHKQYCASCHATEGDTVIVGPSLAGIATWGGNQVEGLDAYEYIQESILEPGKYLEDGYKNLMPASFGETLDAEQLNALMAYMMTLK